MISESKRQNAEIANGRMAEWQITHLRVIGQYRRCRVYILF